MLQMDRSRSPAPALPRNPDTLGQCYKVEISHERCRKIQMVPVKHWIVCWFQLRTYYSARSPKAVDGLSHNNVAWDLLNTELESYTGLAVQQYHNVASHIASSEGLVRIILLQEKQIPLDLPHFSLQFSWNSTLFSSSSKLRYKDYKIEKSAALYKCAARTIVMKTTYFIANWSSVILCHLDHWSTTCTQKNPLEYFVTFPSKSFRELNVKVSIFILTLYMYIIFSVWLKHWSESIGKCTFVNLDELSLCLSARGERSRNAALFRMDLLPNRARRCFAFVFVPSPCSNPGLPGPAASLLQRCHLLGERPGMGGERGLECRRAQLGVPGRAGKSQSGTDNAWEKLRSCTEHLWGLVYGST